ncbi:hypothetical protein SteCoe_6624 [Stentor coeruleus]|uniref:UBC core domain-containing protein n=1 Tax=Stentor coeruleus TaxID=5963 RepID=A0A1R2CPL7_9CILI|nr:hypothetical protein SteCoe_6624 [Stentor coeruleus]
MDDETLAQGLSQLLTMGFDEKKALYALLQASSFEEALDILLNGSHSASVTNYPEYSNPPKIDAKPNSSQNTFSPKKPYVPELIKNLPISPHVPLPEQNYKHMGNINLPTELPINQNSNRIPGNLNQTGGIKPQIFKCPGPQTVLQNMPFHAPPIIPKVQVSSVPLVPKLAPASVPIPPVSNPAQHNPSNSSQAFIPLNQPQIPVPVLKSESSSGLLNNPLLQIPPNPSGPSSMPNVLQVPKFIQNPILSNQKSSLLLQNPQKNIENSAKISTVSPTPILKVHQESTLVPKLNQMPIPQPNTPALNMGFNSNTGILKDSFIPDYPESYPKPSIPITNEYPKIQVPINLSMPLTQKLEQKPNFTQISITDPPSVSQKPILNIQNLPLIPIPNIQIPPSKPIPNIQGPLSLPQKPPPQIFPSNPFPVPNSQFLPPLIPQKPIPKDPNPYINPSNHYQNFPKSQSLQENYKEFLRNALKIKNFPIEAIEDVVKSCTSNEEALLILGIPTYYKDLPISEIPMEIDQSQNFISEDISENDIKFQLIKNGVDIETAELLAQTCSSLEEAYHNLGPQTYNFSKPPIIIQPKTNPQHFKNQPMSYIPKNSLFQNIQPMPSNNLYHPIFPKFSNSIPNQNKNEYFNYGIHSPISKYYDSDIDSDSDDYEYSHYKNNYDRSQLVNLSGPSENDPIAPDAKTEYFERLKDYRMIISEDNTVFMNFSINEVVNDNPQTLKRINAEMKTLFKSVPCDSAASIFVMFDSECNHKVKFLLSGTVDTPYAHGLYLFDVLLPSNYPAVPPKVNLTTTGERKFRFNPNLYETGYVCLSIIGTWSGNPNEQWNPSSSTLLQVMLSIQSLVMDNNIIQKEPSFHNIPHDSIENLSYQLEVKYGNLKFAMIDQLKNPPKGFETIIKEHFKIKKQEILKTASEWVQEAHNFKHKNYKTLQNEYISQILMSKGPGKAFQEAYNELQNLLLGLN